MLINLSNHPSKNWSIEQLNAAEQFGEIVDIPFPAVSPFAPLADVKNIALEYFQLIISKGEKSELVVNLSGEFTLVFSLVELLKREGIQVVCATSERNVLVNDDGTKTIKFDFVAFRNYY